MRLTTRVFICFLSIFIISILFTTVVTYRQVHSDVTLKLATAYQETFSHLDLVLDTFFDQLSHDLKGLALDERVTFRDDSNFTNFLQADPDTFKYQYTPEELAIIHVFRNYMLAHPNVNSVYMGRENGSFVRAYPRSSPTAYDPRTRPWYTAAREVVDQVVLTEPYASVTNNDVNIGSVLALREASGKLYGVVGMDVTLNQLNQIIESTALEYDGQLFIATEAGNLIYSQSPELLFTQYTAYLNTYKSTDPFVKLAFDQDFSTGNLPLIFEENDQEYRLQRDYNRLKARYIVHIPKASIQAQITALIYERLILLSSAFLIVIAAAFLMIELQVLKPLRMMEKNLKCSTDDRVPHPMHIKAAHEFKNFENAYNRLIQQIKMEEVELKQVKLLAINTLTSLAEKRDHETGLHIIRTQKYVELLARAYVMRYQPSGVDDNVIERWVSCSPLHDIGKVAIPDYILLKPGPLTPEEFTIMKDHTRYGKETIERGNMGIEDQGFIQTAINLVYAHHERWDGTGYPEGLSGETIPLEARIMSIADVYDALTNDRVYKAAYSHDQAMSIILDGSGTQFQPELVSLFVELNQTFKMILEQYNDSKQI